MAKANLAVLVHVSTVEGCPLNLTWAALPIDRRFVNAKRQRFFRLCVLDPAVLGTSGGGGGGGKRASGAGAGAGAGAQPQARLDCYASKAAYQRGKAPLEKISLEGLRVLPSVRVLVPPLASNRIGGALV